MSTTIDNNVVEMRFNNSQFESGVQSTLRSLGLLKKSLEFDSASSTASLKNIEAGVTNISSKFSALGVVAATVISNITTMVMGLGNRMMQEFAIQPITDGFKEYELKMGSIQTIMANTTRHGTGLETVNAELDKLNTYSDKTIYNFGEMTKNASLFTSSGMKIEDATQMIKGFSNEAAASGANSQQAAGAAYQLSQALNTGTIRLMDWKSIQNANMGNKNMQDGLLEVASAMGTVGSKTGTTAQSIKENFNGSLEKGWLSADVMSKYLKIMTNDYSVAEIQAMGFTQVQAEGFKKQAEMAFKAATEVRTFTQLMGTLKEGVGSGWAETFGLIVGDFNEATKLFTGINNTLGPMLGDMAKARNDLIKEWATAGGRTDLFAGLGQIFDNLLSVMKSVGKAFGDVFPPITAQRLVEITKGFKEFTERMKPSEATLEKIGRIAKGVFSVLDMGRQVVMFVADAFLTLMGGLVPSGMGFLDVAAALGDFLTVANLSIKSGEGLGKIFKDIGSAVKGGLGQVGPFLSSMGANIDILVSKVKELLGSFKGFGAGIPGLNSLGDSLKGLGEGIASFISSGIARLGEFLPGISSLGSGIAKAIGDLFAKIDLGKVVGLISAGGLVAIGLQISKFIKSLTGMTDNAGGIVAGFKDIFGGITGQLEAMQGALRAEALLKIAAAIGVLALSLLVLSTIDGAQLAAASVGLGVAIGYMVGAMVAIDKMKVNPAKLAAVSVSLILLASAMLIMSAAIKVMSTMSWEELAIGLIGFGVALGAILVFSNLISANVGNLIKASIGIHLMAGAMLALAAAITVFGLMPIDVMLKGGAAVGVLLLMLAGFVKLVPEKDILATAFALSILSGALLVMSGAVFMLGSMGFEALAQGLSALAIMLGLLAISAQLMQGSVGGAVAAAIIAGAIMLLVPPIMALGLAPWQVVLQGIGALALALGVLIIAAYAMQGALPGAAAILVISAALMVLSVAIAILGSLSLAQVGIALLAIAGALTIFGVAALILTPVIPMMYALAGALLLFGLAVIASGVGIMALAVGLAMLAPVALAGAVALLALAGAGAVIGLLSPLLLVAGAGMVLFGAGLLLASVGIVAFGAGLLILGMGLSMIATSGEAGLAALGLVAGAMAGMLVHVIPMGLMAAAFVLLGAGMIAMGAGALVMGAGLVILTVGLLTFSLVAPLAASGVDALTAAFSSMSTSTGAIEAFVGALALITGVIVVLGPGMVGASIATLAFAVSLAALAGSGTLVISVVGLLGSVISATASSMASSMSSMGSSTASGVAVVISALSALGPSVVSTAGQVNAASSVMSAAFQGMGQQSASAVTAGSRLIMVALQPLPLEVTKTAQLVTVASLLMVQAFKAMGAQSASAIAASGSQIRSALSGISSSSGAAAEDVGRSIISGMVRGMSNSGAVTAAARSVALSALSAAKAALDAHSPSREFDKLGGWSVQGLANGLKDNAGTASTAASNMATSVLSAFSKTFGDLSDSVNTNLDMNPTIRPVLDLTDIQNGAKLVNGLLVPPSLDIASGYARAASSSFGASRVIVPDVASTQASPGLIYNQYNSSPKALSRVEIYRQTQNQLSQLALRGV